MKKISNVINPEMIENISSIQNDYITFNFNVNMNGYLGQVEPSLLNNIPVNLKKCGAFNNDNILNVVATAGKFLLSAVELMADETPADCEKIAAEGLEVIKTIDDKSFALTHQYEGVCNKFVFILKDNARIKEYKGNTPFFLKTKSVIEPIHPLMIGCDIDA